MWHLTAAKSAGIKMTPCNVQRFEWTNEHIMHLIIWKQARKCEMILFGKVHRGQGYSEIWRAEYGRVFFSFHGQIQLKQRGLCHFKCCIASVQYGNERSAGACSCSLPSLVWRSSVQHIQTSVKGEQSLRQLCSSLLSRKSKTAAQETLGALLALLLGVSRQFWGQHPWLCLEVGGQRVGGAVGSSSAKRGCSTPCWAGQGSLEKEGCSQALHFTQLFWNEGFPERDFWVVSNLCATATREPKARNIVCGFGKHSTKQALKLDFRSSKRGKATYHSGRWW